MKEETDEELIQRLNDFDPYENDPEPIHLWFGLSYANYFVASRTELQSMPAEWQRRFIKLIQEMHQAIENHAEMCPDGYSVQPKAQNGKFCGGFPHYDRGRTRLKLVSHD